MDALFQVRKAVEADAPAIKKLVTEGRINPTGLDWRRFMVAVNQNGEVIGCGQIKPHRDGSLELASLAVTNEWRRQGVAHAIIEELLAGHDGPLYLMCRSGLGKMYEKYGFQALDEEHMPRYFRRVSRVAGIIEGLQSQGETLLIMGRM
jgi:amino-acid N-acetyltransferase